MEKQLFLRPSDRSYELPYVSRSVFPKLMIGGFLATLAMTLVIYLGPLLGLPNVDLAGILGNFLSGRPPALFSGWWWVGMAWHFFNGTVLFPIVYSYWVYPVLSGDNSSVSISHGFSQHSVSRGTLWGMILWGLCQGFTMPMAGAGIFSMHTLQPLLVIVGSWVAHLVYGGVFGVMTRSREERTIELRETRAA